MVTKQKPVSSVSSVDVGIAQHAELLQKRIDELEAKTERLEEDNQKLREANSKAVAKAAQAVISKEHTEKTLAKIKPYADAWLAREHGQLNAEGTAIIIPKVG
jgi:outer membrane murein-binding lipoprotein Lpp